MSQDALRQVWLLVAFDLGQTGLGRYSRHACQGWDGWGSFIGIHIPREGFCVCCATSLESLDDQWSGFRQAGYRRGRLDGGRRRSILKLDRILENSWLGFEVGIRLFALRQWSRLTGLGVGGRLFIKLIDRRGGDHSKQWDRFFVLGLTVVCTQRKFHETGNATRTAVDSVSGSLAASSAGD